MRMLKHIFILILMVSLVGCLGVHKIQRPVVYYQLNPKVMTKGCLKRTNHILKIMPFVISSPYDSTCMIYSPGKHRVEPSIYFHWIAPPERMIRRYLIESLGDLSLFSAVIGQGSSLHSDYLMEGRIFELDFPFLPPKNVACLRIEVTLIKKNPGKGRKMAVFFRKRYKIKVPIRGVTERPAINEAVDSMNSALELFSKSLEIDLCKLNL